MKAGEPTDLKTIMLETDRVERAIHEAVAHALVRHKRLGNPIVVWRDGQVVWIPAEEIQVPIVESASSGDPGA